MNARIGRVTFSADRTDDLVGHVRETIVPRYEQSEGFKGFTLLVDRSRGEAVGISFWDSEETMLASEDLGDQARQGAADAGSGSDEGKEHFEVAIDTMA